MVAAVLMCSAAGAQVFKFDKEALLKAVAQSDEAIANPKRAERGQTWLDRGNAMFNAGGGALYRKIYPGQDEKAMLLALGKMEPVATELGGMTFQKYSFPYADVYTYNGTVQFWSAKEVVYEEAKPKAVEAYKKAVELDPKLTAKATEGMTYVGDLLGIEANAEYNVGDKVKAAELYWQSFNVKKEPLVGKIDSVSVFNAGNIMYFEGKYDRAIEILTAAMESNVWEDGNTPYLLFHAYMQTDRDADAKKALDAGLLMFPENNDLLESMVDYYAMTGGDFNEIKDMLEKSLEHNPENAAVWNGLGQIYLKGGDQEKTIEFFKRYVEKFPESAQSNFYLGDALYEKGQSIMNAADNDRTMSRAAKDAAVAQAKDMFREAWKYMRASYDLRPEETATIQRLMFIAYSIVDDPGMEDMFKRFEGEYRAKTEGQE
jgi:tetratricopeptide (TPR) repeat protein